jgi:hypothetical protein
MAGGHEAQDEAYKLITHLLALVAGVFMLRGANWARWLAVTWILFHVAISLEKWSALAVHALLAIALLYFLFRPNVSAFFRGAVAAALMLATFAPRSEAQSPAAARAQRDSLLDLMVGEWSASGTTRGERARYRIVAHRILDDKYVDLRMVDAAHKPPQYQAMVIIGEGANPGEFIAHWIDNFGAQYSVPPGTGTRRGDTLSIDFPYTDGTFHDTFAYDRASRSWRWKIESADGKGGWKPFADYDVVGRFQARPPQQQQHQGQRQPPPPHARP